MFWTIFGMLVWLFATVAILALATEQLRDCEEFFDFIIGIILTVVGLASISGLIVVLYNIADN